MSDVDELAARAVEMMVAAYAPYSHFTVGAAVRAASGRVYTGANVENAAYGECVCAERNAIFAAVNAGERRLLEIAVAGGREGEIAGFCPPCGACRQVMREFADPAELRIHLVGPGGSRRTLTLADLLPESFGPSNLAADRRS